MQRWKTIRRTFLSFLWVSCAFLVYSFCIAPFIESTRDEDDAFEGTADETSQLPDDASSDRVTRELAALFPKGSWELDRPKVIRSQQATILLNDFEQQGDSLRIKKCSLVFYGSDRNQPDPNGRGPVILQAPQGAILDFDEPIDLSGGVVGRPVGGKLVGDIRIFSAGGVDSEDLEMITRNVVITDQRIWTPEPVAFRLGNNYGSGQYLIIERADAPRGMEQEQDQGQDWLAGLGRIELQHLDRFTVEMAGDDMFDALHSEAGSEAKQDPAVASKIELRCDGPLHFDMHGMIATADQNVRITRSQNGGPSDTVYASKLSMRLARVRGAGKNGEKSKAKLAVTRIVAVGDPLIIDARSRQSYVECKRLEYDFDSKQIQLKGFHPFPTKTPSNPEQTGQVRIQSPLHTVKASAINFVGTQDRGTWHMQATGPGQYIGIPTGNAKQKVAAFWTKQVTLVPDQGQQVLTLEGQASVRAPDVGLISAELIKLWIQHETVVVAHRIDGVPIEETKSRPTKLVTESKHGGPTQIEAPQLRGTLSKLTIHIDQTQAVSEPPADPPLAPFGSRPVAQPSPTSPRRTLSQYHVEGGELTAWVNPQQELRRLMVRGPTRLVEVSGQRDRAFELKGNAIDYQIDPDGTPTALLEGTPAVLTSLDMGMSGETIRLIGDRNRLEIPGSGSLRVRVPEHLIGNPSGPQPPPAEKAFIDLDIGWQGALVFDGQVAEISSKVSVSTQDLSIRTPHLRVTLRESIDFSDLQDARLQPEIQDITAAGGIVVANRTRDELGETTGYQQMVAQDFHLNYQTGKMTANGPGWLAMTSLGGVMTTNAVAPSRRTTASTRMQLSVAFADQLDGNLHDRTCRLTDDVRSWYGAVTEWEDRVDPVPTRTLQDEELRMTCRELFVMEAPVADRRSGREPIELLARGETYVESQNYAAKGHQIKFAEDKGMLTLEGDTHRPAELWQRNLVSGTSSHSGQARTIRYWPKTGQLEVKFLGIDLSQTPQTRK